MSETNRPFGMPATDIYKTNKFQQKHSSSQKDKHSVVQVCTQRVYNVFTTCLYMFTYQQYAKRSPPTSLNAEVNGRGSRREGDASV